MTNPVAVLFRFRDPYRDELVKISLGMLKIALRFS